MKKFLVALAAAATPALAADFTDTAQVVSSAPIHRQVNEPRQECWTESAPVQEKSYAGAIIGGLAGAVIGNQVGSGAGKTAATAVGAAAGAMVGDRVANPDSQPVSGGSIAGAVVGGVLGSQVGNGSGSDAAAAVGAAGGAIIGDRVSASNQPASTQRCRQVDAYRQEVSGYNVVYRYNGREMTTTLPYNPGATLNVAVSVVR